MKMQGFFIITASFALTTAVVANAWIQKKQFYPTVVYLTKSSPCVAVLYIQAFIFVLLFAKLVRKIFFGQLRPAEMEHLIERSWYAVTDTCLAFTMFRDDFSPLFVGSFTLLLFLKSFHWLLEDRVDYMERSPVITFLFKLRVLSLLAILLTCDIAFVNKSYQATVTKGASVQLVFGFEYAILATVTLTIFLKYILHTIDLQSDTPWENKAVYMLYVELITGFFRVLLYICFTIVMVQVHAFPLFSIRPMYLAMRQFKKALTDIVMSRRAIRNMNTLYPDATTEELSSADSTCIICREEMQAPAQDNQPAQRGSSETGVNKKLPCGHIFHASCLRSWFQRQQSCPTCRLDVLQARAPVPPVNPPPDPAAAPQNHPQFPPMPPMFPPMHPAMFPGAPVPPHRNENNAPAPSASSSAPEGQQSSSPVPPTPFPMFMSPPFMPPPIPPPNFSGMTEEQVREMEGVERRSVEARIECLRNINNLLDAAMQQIVNYITVVQSQGGAGLQIPPFPNLTPDLSSNRTNEPADTQDTDNPPDEDIAGTSGVSNPSPETTVMSSDDNETSAATSDAELMRRRRLEKLSPKSPEQTSVEEEEK